MKSSGESYSTTANISEDPLYAGMCGRGTRPVPSSWGSTSQENEATSSDVSWKYGLTKMPMEAKVIFCKWHRKFQAVVGGGNLSFKFHHLTKYHNRKTYLYLFVFPHHSTYLINVPVFLSGPPRKKGPEIWENPRFFFFFFRILAFAKFHLLCWS